MRESLENVKVGDVVIEHCGREGYESDCDTDSDRRK